VLGPHRQPGQQDAERLDRLEHGYERVGRESLPDRRLATAR
jgi:hypothetical protein